MEIKELNNSLYVTLKPVGDLDANSSIVLDEKIQSLLENNQNFINIDCSDVPYMSSAGMGVFIAHLDEIKSRKGKLVLSNLVDSVLDVLELLGLNQLIDIASNEKEVNNLFKR